MATIVRRKNRAGKARPYWSYVILCADGMRREYRGHPSKADTQREASEREAKERAIREGISAPQVPYAEAVEQYLAHGRVQGGRNGEPWARRHAQNVEQSLCFWGEVLELQQLSDVRLIDVEAQARKRLRTHAAKSVRNLVEPLRALCLYAFKRQLLDRDPLAAWSPPKAAPRRKTRPLSRDEVDRLVAVAAHDARLAYLTAVWTGYRVGELSVLLLGDLDGRWVCLDAPRTKGRRAARQPIPLWLAEELHDQAERMSPDAPLLQIPKGGSSYNMIRRDLQRACVDLTTSAGSASWHSLRKTYLTEIAPFISDPRTLQELARHKDLSLTLERYAGTTDQRKIDVIEAATASWSCGAGLDPSKEKPAELQAGRVKQTPWVGLEPTPMPITDAQWYAEIGLPGHFSFEENQTYDHPDATQIPHRCGAFMAQMDPTIELSIAADRFSEFLRIFRAADLTSKNE